MIKKNNWLTLTVMVMAISFILASSSSEAKREVNVTRYEQQAYNSLKTVPLYRPKNRVAIGLRHLDGFVNSYRERLPVDQRFLRHRRIRRNHRR